MGVQHLIGQTPTVYAGLLLTFATATVMVASGLAQPGMTGTVTGPADAGTMPSHQARERLQKAANNLSIANGEFAEKYTSNSLHERLRTWAAANQPGFVGQHDYLIDRCDIFEAGDACQRLFYQGHLTQLWTYIHSMPLNGRVKTEDVDYFEKGAAESIAHGRQLAPSFDRSVEILHKMTPIIAQIGALKEKVDASRNAEETRALYDQQLALKARFNVLDAEMDKEIDGALRLAAKRFIASREPEDLASVPRPFRVRFMVRGPGGLREVPGGKLPYSMRTVAEVEFDHAPKKLEPLTLTVGGSELALPLKLDAKNPLLARSDEFVLWPAESGAPPAAGTGGGR